MEEIREIDENNENKTDVNVMLAFDYIGGTDARAWGCGGGRVQRRRGVVRCSFSEHVW